MSDHADIVREALGSGDRLVPGTISEAEAEAFAALDALVADRDRANVEWHRIRDLHGEAIKDLRARQAEVVRLNHDAAAWEKAHREAEAEADRLREALGDLNEYAARMPGYSLHPLTERARAALGGSSE